MSTNELRNYLHKFIDLADERFLSSMYQMTKQNEKEKVEYFKAGNAISKKQLYIELKEAEAEIENGDYMNIEDFDKESEKWG